MSVPITIYLPKATIDAIRESAGINSNIRTLAHATSVTMPAVIAAVNNIPADVIGTPIATENTPAPADGCQGKASPEVPFELVIRYMARQTHVLDVEPSFPVDFVKGMLTSKTGLLPYHQRLFFEGKQLQGNRTLSSYGICAQGDVVSLVPSLWGP